MKLKVLEKIVKQYGLIDGQMISGNLLKQIAEEQKMEINELITLLGISEINIYKILKKDTISMKINIKDELERKEIKNYIQQILLNKDRITRDELEKLEKQTKMTGRLIALYIGVGCKTYYALKNNYKYVYLKAKFNINNSDKIIESIKMKDKITKEEIENIKEIYHKSDREMISILKVERENYRNLINGKTKFLNIDLLSEKEKGVIIQNLKNYKEEGNVINIEDINYLKQIVSTSDKLIRNIYGISSSVYNRLLAYKTKTCRIIDTKERKKVELLKIEMKYNEKYGERYYTKKELNLMMKQQNLNLESMLLYMSHPKHYAFNKLALEKNPNGIWIGKNKQITYEFWTKELNLLEKLSNQAAIGICKMYGVRYDKNELTQIAYEHITDTGFLIEKNFGFDKRLQNNLFRKKGKYAILNFLKTQNQLYSYQNYEEQFGITEERSMTFADNSSNPDYLIEQQTDINSYEVPIYNYHQKIIIDNGIVKPIDDNK